MGKRANTQATAKAAAKKAKLDPVFVSIADVILETDALPTRCRTMLVDVLPFTLSTPVDERHEIQTATFEMVEQTLSSKKSVLEAAVVSEGEKLATVTASQAECSSKVCEAETALAAQRDALQTAKCSLAEATTTANASRDKLTQLRAEQESGDAKLAAAKNDKSSLESAFENHFKPMKEDAAGPHFKELEPFLKTFDMEESLLIALPSTCAKSKEHRGTFDHVVLDELEKAICAKIASLDNTVRAETPAAVERATATEAAQKDYDAKKDAQMQAVSAFEAAQKEQGDRELVVSKAQQAFAELQPQIDAASGLVDKVKLALEAFVAGPMAGLKALNVATSTTPASEAATAGA
jgi:chromosome segregation ATPase